MYDLPPRRLVSLILVKLGPAHLVSCSCQRSQSSPAPGRAHGHSYFITGSTNFTVISFICNDFIAVGYADKARASQPSAPPSTGGSRLSRARRLLSYKQDKPVLMLQREVDALGVINISRGCFECQHASLLSSVAVCSTSLVCALPLTASTSFEHRGPQCPS